MRSKSRVRVPDSPFPVNLKASAQMSLFLHEMARWIRIKRGKPSENDKLWLEAKAKAKAFRDEEIAVARAEEPLIREKAIAKLKARATTDFRNEVWLDLGQHDEFATDNSDLYYHTNFVANLRKMGYYVRVSRILDIVGFTIKL